MAESDDTLAPLRALPPAERRAFCDRVVRNLSELVEGTADEDLRREVEQLLGRCRPYLAVRSTLEATIRELEEIGEETGELADDPGFSRCVETVRRRLEKERRAEGSRD